MANFQQNNPGDARELMQMMARDNSCQAVLSVRDRGNTSAMEDAR